MSHQALIWIGRAQAAIEESSDPLDIVAFRSATEKLASHTNNPDGIRTIRIVLYRALARAELDAPAIVAGSFIPTDSPFDAMLKVGKILKTASSYIRIIDPYADENLLSDYIVQAPEAIQIEILADQRKQKPALAPAVRRWTQQYGNTRPLTVRLAAPGTLHDRIIFIDRTKVWVVGQSFNALATRSPTSLIEVDSDTAALKIDAYESVWQAATTLA